jgi:hypothetical protein
MTAWKVVSVSPGSTRHNRPLLALRIFIQYDAGVFEVTGIPTRPPPEASMHKKVDISTSNRRVDKLSIPHY